MFEKILCKKPQLNKSNGYYYCIFKKKGKVKNYKRSRVIYQLYYNVELSHLELIHHMDENKENDCIKNLRLTNNYLHTSYHAGGRKNTINK